MKPHTSNTDSPVDFPKPYKQQVIESSLEGLRQGGFPPEYAQVFEIFLDKVYQCGYNEAVRNLRSRNGN